MSDARDDGGPAFPNHFEVPREMRGMKLRDWFAGQVLPQAMNDAQRLSVDQAQMLFPGRAAIPFEEVTACLAYKVADAMLAERKRKS